MSNVVPFKGIVYNPDKVGDLNKVVAPPYDVISPALQDDLYSRHPNNIVRLILGKINDTDTPGNDRYSRAASALKAWQEGGELLSATEPTLYYYTQTYGLKYGGTLTRKGFIGLSKVEEFGTRVFPHEKTLSGPKKDRLRIMDECEANLSCIFTIYPEPKDSTPDNEKVTAMLATATEGKDPMIDVKDDDGLAHKVWAVTDSEILCKISKAMDKRTIYIADGHHRYETALNYRNKMREKTGSTSGEEAFNYIMMYFSSMDDDGMTIFPTHRAVHSLADFDGESFLKNASEYFNISELPFDSSNEVDVRGDFFGTVETGGDSVPTFGLYMGGDHTYYTLSLKGRSVMDDLFGDTIPEVYKDLDVTILHSILITKLLGITQEAQEKKLNLKYIKSSDDSIGEVNAGGAQLCFIMNSTKVEEIKAVAEAGSVMPQKSTYFYPKLLSGLVINPLGLDVEITPPVDC